MGSNAKFCILSLYLFLDAVQPTHPPKKDPNVLFWLFYFFFVIFLLSLWIDADYGNFW
jgi:hypothetical protein